MSYGRDPDMKHRGVGAIAAIDGAGNRRRRSQARKLRVMNVIDARHAQLAHGPKRALPVPMGRIMEPYTEGSGGGSGSGGSGGGGTIPTRPAPIYGQTAASSFAPAPIAPAVSMPTSTMTPTIPGTSVVPAPTSTVSVSTGTVGGGKTPYKPPGYSGGGGSFSMPGQPVPSFTEPSAVDELPPPGPDTPKVSGKTLALVAGGIGLLWLLTRKQD